MNKWIQPLEPAISTQAGYTVADMLGKLIARLFNITDRAVINMIIGIAIPFSIKKWFKNWKIPDQFLGGMYITGWNGLATLIYNLTNSEKKNVTVNGLLSSWFGFPNTELAGSKKGLGQDNNYIQLPNGVVVAPLPNGNYIDQQGNVYTPAQISSFYQTQQLPAQALYGDDDGDEDTVKDFELLMGKLSNTLNRFSGDEGEEETREYRKEQDITLNGTDEYSIILS